MYFASGNQTCFWKISINMDFAANSSTYQNHWSIFKYQPLQISDDVGWKISKFAMFDQEKPPFIKSWRFNVAWIQWNEKKLAHPMIDQNLAWNCHNFGHPRKKKKRCSGAQKSYSEDSIILYLPTKWFEKWSVLTDDHEPPTNIMTMPNRSWKTTCPLVICYIAIENGPVEIVSFPMKKMVDLSI